jgi:lysophospholipase L1-like esterase
VIVAVFPTYGGIKDWRDYLYASLHAQVREAAEQRGFMVVDMLPVFVGSGLDVLGIAADDEHPNAKGNELVAGKLQRVIAQHQDELLKIPVTLTQR